jgi:transposase
MGSGGNCASARRAPRPAGGAIGRPILPSRTTTKDGFGARLKRAQCERAWAFDEGRFGLKVWFRRRWRPRGVRPPWIVEDQDAWRWLSATVEPATGERFFLLLPGMDSACLQVFLDAFRQHAGTERIGLVLDGSGAHGAKAVGWPEGIVPLTLPPYSPELNPVELVFRQLRARLANQVFADIAALEAALTAELRIFWAEPVRLQQLTGFAWWLKGIRDILP